MQMYTFLLVYRVTLSKTLFLFGGSASLIEMQSHCKNILLYLYDFCARAAVESLFTRTGRRYVTVRPRSRVIGRLCVTSGDVTRHTNRISLFPSTVPTSRISFIHMCASLFNCGISEQQRAVEQGYPLRGWVNFSKFQMHQRTKCDTSLESWCSKVSKTYYTICLRFC